MILNNFIFSEIVIIIQGDPKLPPPLHSRIVRTLGKINDCPSKYNVFKKSLQILVLGKNIFGEIFIFRETPLFFSNFWPFLATCGQIFVYTTHSIWSIF